MRKYPSPFSLLSLSLLLLTSTSLLAQTRPTGTPQEGPKEDRKLTSVVADWLKHEAIPIKSVEAGNGFADLQPLKEILAGVRVVGLGEATHGTREFFQFKHRVVEFLVREMNFNVFAIEANYAACLRVNDYVMGGSVSRAEALDSLGVQVWQTEEVAALVDWLRAYNQTAAPDRKVRFYGFDMQDMGRAWDVLGYLQQVAPEKAQEVSDTLTRIGKAVQSAFSGSKESLTALRPEIDRLISYFVLQESDFVYKTSRARYEENLHRLRLLAQSVDVFSQQSNEARDRYMAENVVRLLNAEPAGTRIALWAHNGHVSTGGSAPGGKPMGAYLRQKLGDAYYAFGFAFNEGSFQATSAGFAGPDVQYAEYTVGPAGEGSLNWYLAQPGIGNYMIDFRHSPKDEAIRQWLTTPRPFCWWGGYNVPPDYKEGWAAGNCLRSSLGQEYDGMIFIERTTRARPLKREELKTAESKRVAQRLAGLTPGEAAPPALAVTQVFTAQKGRTG